jgi:hypothetical protein
MYGLNDIDQKPVGGTNSFGVTRAFEMWVSRMRAAGPIYEDTDASFAFTGAWAVLNVTDRNTGTGYHYTTSADASYTITTPSTFPGGTVAVRISSQSPGATAPASPSPGATHTAYVDGIVAGRVVARSEAAGTENTSVLRVRNVPAGEQTITVQIDDITGLTAVDGWWWECPVDAGPLVVLAAQPYLPAGGYAAFLPSVKGDAQIDALNAILRNMVTLFGPRVVVADSHLAAMNANPTHFKVDLVHPNTTGCALIGQAIIDAIAAKQYTLTAAS